MRRLLISLPMLAIAVCSWSESLTIKECVALAREHYPAVAQYGLLENTARFNLSNVSKSWLPQGTVYAQGTWQNEVMELPDALSKMMAMQGADYTGLEKLQYKVGVDVNQQIWDGGKASANRKSIEAGTDVERKSLSLQLYDVEGRVEDLYFALLLYDARIVRADKSIALVDSTLRQVRSMFANGMALQSDCDQIEARLLTLQQQRVKMIAARESYQRILEIFIGEQIAGRNLILPEKEITHESNHPQLQLFDARVNHIMAQEAGIKASVMPKVGAFATAYYGYPGFNMFKNMQNRDMSFNFMAGVKVTWNFGSLYTRPNSLRKLQIQRQQVDVDRETFLFNNHMAESEHLGQIEGLREMMQNDKRIVELRGSVMRAAQSQLHNGVIDATDLLTKITDEELAENDLALHHIELTKAQYQLNHIRNK